MSTPDRWSRVSDILSKALDIPEGDRGAFVSSALEAEPELRTEVLALLAELGRTSGFLERPPADLRRPPAGRPEAFGSYRVVGELGEGGMGVVYLAERNDGRFTRRVAVKRVGRAAAGPEVRRRFADEQQILARLDHPNVARLLDAGLDDEGVPYFVMEHVEGAWITRHCREAQVPLPQRLALFLKVCAAVEHAHRHLVVHRDIKPANILVTAEGEPKLLDFGIAKALGEGADGAPTADRALTLDYASPEQVRGEAVTTASDVYSLGVLFYELLADAKPYEVGTSGLSEAVRLVCETVPPPPSLAAPADRRAEVAGDLDAVATKALAKSPADRYGSVAELAADVAAFLGHLPVKARRPSFPYVARKLVQRHRRASVAAAVAFLLAAGGVTAIVWQARAAERERARAERRFDQLRQLAHYMIFDLQDGITKLAGATELRRQMVARSLAYLDSLAAEAAGDAGLQLELAAAYVRLGDVLGRRQAANLGDVEGSLQRYGQARRLLEQIIARDPGQVEARRQLARLLLAIHEALPLDREAERTAALDQAMGLWTALVQEDATNEANLRGLASAHFAKFGALRSTAGDEAVGHMERALALFEQLLRAKPEDADRQRNVGLCHKYLVDYFSQRDAPRALGHAQEAVRLDAARVQAVPQNVQARTDYSISLSALGDLHVVEGNETEALRLFEEALALRRELVAADTADAHARELLAYMLARVAEMHVLAGRYSQAAPLIEESLEHARGLPVRLRDRTVVFVLAKAYLLRGEVAVSAHLSPCASYREMAELLPPLPKMDDVVLFDPRTEELRERAILRLRSCQDRK